LCDSRSWDRQVKKWLKIEKEQVSKWLLAETLWTAAVEEWLAAESEVKINTVLWLAAEQQWREQALGGLKRKQAIRVNRKASASAPKTSATVAAAAHAR